MLKTNKQKKSWSQQWAFQHGQNIFFDLERSNQTRIQKKREERNLSRGLYECCSHKDKADAMSLPSSKADRKSATRLQYEQPAIIPWQSNHVGHGHPQQSAKQKRHMLMQTHKRGFTERSGLLVKTELEVIKLSYALAAMHRSTPLNIFRLNGAPGLLEMLIC